MKDHIKKSNRKRRKSENEGPEALGKKVRAENYQEQPLVDHNDVCNDQLEKGLNDGRESCEEREISVVQEGRINEEKENMSILSVLNLLKVQQTKSTGLQKMLELCRQDQKGTTVVKGYLKVSPECKELFHILEGEERPSSQMSKLVWDIFESILLATSDSENSLQSFGLYIANRILSKHLKQIYSSLSSSTPADLTKAVLRMLTAILAQGKQGVFEILANFDFTLKALETLPRRRDRKAKVDVRTTFIRFFLAFLMFGDIAAAKQVLELQVFSNGLFNGLSRDSPETVYLVLSTLTAKVIKKSSFLKKTKIAFFNSHTLMQLAHIYVAYNDELKEEDKDGREVQEAVLGMIMEIFEALCTNLECGICFANQHGAFAGRSNNPVLLKFLRSLQKLAVSQPKLQNLISQSLSASHDLIIPFISTMGINLEPRMSLPWKNNISFLTDIWSSLPPTSKLIKDGGHTISSSNLHLLMKLVFPSFLSKSILVNGLKQSSFTVKQKTIDLMLICIKRAASTWSLIKNKEICNADQCVTVEELFLDLVIKQLPEASVVVAVRQSLASGAAEKNKEEEAVCDATPTDKGMPDSGRYELETSVLELMKYYQQMRPGIFSNCDYNICKLFKYQKNTDMFDSPMLLSSFEIALMEPFGSLKWFTKKSDAYSTALQLVFDAYVITTSSEIKIGSKYLIIKLLRETGCVNDYIDEIDAWLESLSLTFQEIKDTELANLFHHICSTTVSHLYSIIDELTEIMAEESMNIESIESDMTDPESSNIENEKLEFSPLVVGALRFFVKNLNSNGNSKSLVSLTRLLTPLLMDKLMSQKNPVCLVRVIRKYTQLIMEHNNEELSWIKDWLDLEQFAFNWCSSLGLALRTPEEKVNFTSNKFDQRNNNDKTFASIVREVFPVSLKTLAKIEGNMDDFKSRLTSSLVSQYSKGKTICDGIRIILNCLKNIDKVRTKKVSGTCNDLYCFFGGLIRDCVVVHQGHSVQGKERTGCPDLCDFPGQDSRKEGELDELFSLVLEFPIFQDKYLHGDFGKASIWITDFLKIVLDSTSSDDIRLIVSLYLNNLVDAFELILRSNGSQSFDDKSELLRALGYFLKNMTQKQCDVLITGIISSLKRSTCEKHEMDFLIRSLVSLVEEQLKVSSSNEGFIKGPFHDQFFVEMENNFPECSKPAFAWRTSPINEGSSPLNNHIQDLFSLLVDNHNEMLEQMVLNIIKTNKGMASFAPISVLDSCLRETSANRSQIAGYLVRASPLHAKHLLTWLENAQEVPDVIQMLPIFQALLLHSSSSIKKKSSAKLQGFLDQFLTIMTENEISSSLSEDQSEILVEILIVLISSLKDRDIIITSLLLMTEKMANSYAVNSRSKYQLELFELLVMPDIIDKKNHSVAFKVLPNLMKIFEKVLSKEGNAVNQELEATLHRMIAKMCSIVSLQTETKMKANEIQPAVDNWSSLLKTALKNRINDPSSLSVLRSLITTLYSIKAFKKKSKLGLETIYNFILSHSLFLSIMLDADKNQENKEMLIDLLLSIADMKASVCEESHLQAFLAAYNATMSSADQKLLHLLKIYENNGISMLSLRPFLWGSEGLRRRKETLNENTTLYNLPIAKEIMELLDRNMLLKSAYNFPLSMDITDSKKYLASRGDIYDPAFLLPVFSHGLRPGFEVDCRKFIEIGCLAFVIAASSCDHVATRKSAYHVIARFMNQIESGRFREKNQVVILLESLRNAISDEALQLPSISCSFVIRCFQVLLRTDQHLYPIINNFLLQKPCLDLKDVPLLLPMLNSANLQSITERSWILKLLLSGLRSATDYYIYKRRHVFELLMSLRDSPICDNAAKKPIADLLLSSSLIHPAAFDLVKNYGLLSWTHARLLSKDKNSADFAVQMSSNLVETFKHGFQTTTDDKEIGIKKPIPQNFPMECILLCVSLLDNNSSSLNPIQHASLMQVIHWCLGSSASVIHMAAFASREHICKLIHQCNKIAAENSNLATQISRDGLGIIKIWLQQRMKTNATDLSDNLKPICWIFYAVFPILRRTKFDQTIILAVVDILKYISTLFCNVELNDLSSISSAKVLFGEILDILASLQLPSSLINRPKSTETKSEAMENTESASSAQVFSCPIIDRYNVTCSLMSTLQLELHKLLVRIVSCIKNANGPLQTDGLLNRQFSAYNEIVKESPFCHVVRLIGENADCDVEAIDAQDEDFFDNMHILAMEIVGGRKATDYFRQGEENINSKLTTAAPVEKLKKKGKNRKKT